MRGRVCLIVALLSLVVWLSVRYGDQITVASLAEHETALHAYQAEHPLLVFGAAFLIYVSIAGLSLPGATVLTLVYGWYFGVLPAALLVSFASTMGATVAFLLSRHLLRDWVNRRFGDRLEGINKNLDEQGAFYLFSLRLIPLVPFFILNAVMGLTRLRVRTFWWVSQLGMFPATVAYAYAGSTFPDLKTLAGEDLSAIVSVQLLLAFALLGTLPLVLKRVVNIMRPTDS
ncbi:MAG TPA: TVP38/TMEM64 family protein [Planctomycetaceae bacterium]|nr:TVP38/TMEM64 family protein [Planctomycetaceae bacterium]